MKIWNYSEIAKIPIFDSIRKFSAEAVKELWLLFNKFPNSLQSTTNHVGYRKETPPQALIAWGAPFSVYSEGAAASLADGRWQLVSLSCRT